MALYVIILYIIGDNMKNVVKRILFILFIIIFVAIIGIIIYSVATHKNVIGNLINNITKEPEEDYHNGIYYFEKPLGKNYNVFSGCNVSAITTYVVVMNDKFLVYDGSCLRNVKIDEGKTEDLVFSVDKDTNKYQVTYKDTLFKKNDKVNRIIATNNLNTRYTTSSLETLDFIIDTVETEGNYFPINVTLNGSVKKFGLKFQYNEQAKYFTEIITSNGVAVYNRSFPKKEDRPVLSFVNNNIAVLEKDISVLNDNDFRYKYNLILLTKEEAFNLRNDLPIIINGERIDMNKNIYIVKGKNNTFKMLVGTKNTFCDDEMVDSDEVSYYEFVIKYNGATDNFDSPELVKIGKYSEGCSYVKKYFLGG